MPHQLLLDFPTKTSYAPQDFKVSRCNERAYEWLLGYQDWPSACVVLYGPRGSGKTHLSHVWGDGEALFLDKLDGNLLDLVQNHSKFVLDSLEDFLKVPEALFHFMNIMKEQGKQALFLSTQAPAHMNIPLKDLDSRLKACAVCEVEAPDDNLLRALILKHASDHQIVIGEDVLKYLLIRMERSFKAAQETVEVLATQSLRDHRPISIPFVKDVLQS